VDAMFDQLHFYGVMWNKENYGCNIFKYICHNRFGMIAEALFTQQ
jgi:hypothetical protein